MQKSHTYKFILCLIGILSCVLLFFLTRSVCRTGDEARAESYADIYTYGDSSAEETKIFCQELEGEWYLFLPSREADTVHLYGTEQGTEDVALSEEQETIYESDFGKLHILRSQNIPSVYFTSEDPAEFGRDYIDQDNDHENRTSGSLALCNSNGKLSMREGVDQIRVRGNSTALLEKKPYKVTLHKKQDLLSDGSKQTDYALLAGAADPSLIRNRLSYDLQKELSYPHSIQAENVDLYYDGEYRGNYLLTELPGIERTDARLAPQQLNNDRQNSGLSSDTVTTLSDTNGYGLPFTYIAEAKAPDKVDGGYLVEMDNAYYETSLNVFMTSYGSHFEVVSPKYCSKEEMLYISELFERMYRTVQGNGTSPDSGLSLDTYFDYDSLAAMWSISEVTGNLDAFNSSTYFYTLEGQEKIYGGPLWDFDNGAGVSIWDSDETMDYWHWIDFMDIYKIKKANGTYYQTMIAPMIDDFVRQKCKAYTEELAWSAAMDDLIWPGRDKSNAEYISEVETYYHERNQSILRDINEYPDEVVSGTIAIGNRDFAVGAKINLRPIYSPTEDGISIKNLSCRSEDKTWDLSTGPVEDTYEEGREYLFFMTIEPNFGRKFDPGIQFEFANGKIISQEMNADGKIELVLSSGMPKVENTVYEGIDYDLVYDKDYYLSHYPEVFDEVGDGDEDVLRYFIEEGIPEGEQGCEHFSVLTYLEANDAMLRPYYGEDYSAILEHYLIGGGYEGGFTGDPTQKAITEGEEDGAESTD